MFVDLEFIDFKVLQKELDLIKEEIRFLAPIKNANILKYKKEFKLINESCVESLILEASKFIN